MPLTPRQHLFVNEYLVDMNATNAAIQAGYSPKTAKSQASRLLTNVNLKSEILKKQKSKHKLQLISRLRKIPQERHLVQVLDSSLH